MTVPIQEAGIIGHHHTQEEPYFPAVPLRDTLILFDHIPEHGPWQLPKPWHILEKEDPKGFRVKWDVMLSMWVQYLDSASKGFQVVETAVTGGDIIPDVQSLDAATYFGHSGLKAKSYEEYRAKVLSVRRAFAALMSKDEQERMGMKGEDILVSDEDIRNARKLVGNFVFTIPYLSRPALDFED